MNAAALDALEKLDGQFRSAGAEMTPEENKVEYTAAKTGSTPPSSYCGSECLYNVMPINKFFQDKKKEYWCSSIDEVDDNDEKGEGDNLDEGVDESKSRFAKALAKVHPVPAALSDDEEAAKIKSIKSAEDSLKTTTTTKTLQTTNIEGRQTKFSFFDYYEKTKPADDGQVDQIIAAVDSKNQIMKAPSIPSLMDEDDVGPMTKISFFGSRDAGSAFDNLGSKDDKESIDKKHVRFIPIIDSIFEDSAALDPVCSFADSLSTRSSEHHRQEAMELPTKRYTRLTDEERKKILKDCRAYRLQIATFEDLFLKEHGKMPTESSERFQLASVYGGYREGKRAIRADAASRIQALWRGALVRSKHMAFWAKKFQAEAARMAAILEKEDAAKEAKKQAEAAADAEAPEKMAAEDKVHVQGLENGSKDTIKEMAKKNIKELQILKSSLFQEETVNKVTHSFYTPPKIEDKDWASPEISEEIEAICTPGGSPGRLGGLPVTLMGTSRAAKVGIEKEQGFTRETIVEYLDADERREMATKALTARLIKDCMLPEDPNAPEAICSVCEMPKLASRDTCVILDECAICDVLREVVEKRAQKRREKEAKKQKKVAELETKKREIEKKLEEEKREREEMKEREEIEEGRRLELLLGDQRPRMAGMDWSMSVPSMLHLPVDVGAAHTSGSSESSERERYQRKKVDEDHEILQRMKKEIDQVEVSSDDTFSTAKELGSPNKGHGEEDEKGEKDEFDCLLDDADIQQLQRKLHNCPSPSELPHQPANEEVLAAESEKKCKLEPPGVKDHKEEKEEEEGYGGFPTKADYDNFQQMYGSFEKEHADVVEYVRERVGDKVEKKKAKAHKSHIRSSSAPSLSSVDNSRDLRTRQRYRDEYREDEYHSSRHHRNSSSTPRREGKRSDRYEREQRHRHGRSGVVDHYSAGSVSELSPPHVDDERKYRHGRRHRGHSSERRPSRHSHSRDRGYHDRHVTRSYSRERGSRHRGYTRDRHDSPHRHRSRHGRRSHSRERRYSGDRRYSRDRRDRSHSGVRASREYASRGRDYRHRSVSSGRGYHRDERRDAGYCSTIYSTDYSTDCSPRRPIDSRDRGLSFDDIISGGAMRGTGELRFDWDYGR